MSPWLPITRGSVMGVKTAVLFSEFRDLRLLLRWAWVPDGRAPEPAVIHRFARRLLVFKLPNQLALGFNEGTGDLRALSNSYQLRKGRAA